MTVVFSVHCQCGSLGGRHEVMGRQDQTEATSCPSAEKPESKYNLYVRQDF